MRDQPEWRLDCRPRAQQPGRDLGYTRYDKVAGARLYAEHVAEREAIRPALQRASLNSLSSCAGVS